VIETHDVSEPAAPIGGGGLTRFRLDFGYDGTNFSGWARQPGLRTVQETLESAAATVLRLKTPALITVAGRTDAGVHAAAQVAHVDLVATAVMPAVVRRLNGLLPEDVRVFEMRPAPAGFEARFAAMGRRYLYRLADRGANPMRRVDTVTWPRPLSVAAMHEAARALVGLNDFAAYAKPRLGATTVRTLHSLTVTRDFDDVVVIRAHADAFCHSQVRSMVGALIAVGEGRRPVEWPGEVLASKLRNSTAHVAPAHGLTLVAVDYPPVDELEARARLTRARRAADASGQSG
jgi:tRNA pseudouridine38-40 synthase